MKCPECNVENLDDSKFCRECATPLPVSGEASATFTKTLEIPAWDIKPGAIIAEKYQIIDVLGRGGMGVVYKAEDIKLKRTVALKFLPPELTQDAEARERFVQEARAASALDHNNICTIYEIGETAKDQVFISMAFYEGESLKDKIKRGPLDIDEATGIILQLAEGLAKAHEKGIIHRDIKPANVLFSKDGVPKIVDFGLAKLGGEVRLTKVGTTMGTVAYMSPQQAKGEEVDQRSDIWALGVVLYEMLCGELPFKGDHEQTLVYSILNEQPKPLANRMIDIPEVMGQVISNTLEKDLEKRYQRLGDLIEDLKSIAGGIEPARIMAKLRQRKMEKKKRALLIGGTAGFVIIVAIIALVTFINNSTVLDSIAVLPLENLSGDPEQNVFVEGMHDALVTELSKISALKVKSRFSVMRFKDSEKTLPEIAQALNVEGIVTGSAQHVGETVRITIQLIDVKTEENLWAESFDQDYSNVLMLHKKAAQAIAQKIRINISPHEQEALESDIQVIPEAHNAYLRGQHFRYQTDLESLNKSVEYYQQAIDLDSEYAEPYAGMAISYSLLTQSAGSISHAEGWQQVEKFATRAVELNDSLSDAHFALAVSHWLGRWDWDSAEEEFLQSIELNRSSAEAHLTYALLLGSLRRHQEALDHALKARDLDPLNPWIGAEVGEVLWYGGDYENALKETEKILEIYPDYFRGFAVLDIIYSVNGMESNWFENSKNLDYYTSLSPEEKETYEGIYSREGYKALIVWMAEKIEKDTDSIYLRPMHVAMWHVLAGSMDRAFVWLEKAYDAHSSYLMFLLVHRCFNPLRSDPRFDELIRRIGFPQDAIRRPLNRLQ